jgi:sugar diacid utilization regulator
MSAADARIDTGDIIGDLINLLHHSATAEEFALRLAQVEALPDSLAQKSNLTEIVRMALAVRNRMDLQQQRERGMMAVIDSAQDLSSRLDLSSLLRAIVSRARNLLGAHLAWLSTYDTEQKWFRVLVVDGAMVQGTTSMVAKKDSGVASVIMTTRMPFSTPDYLHDNRFSHDPKLDNVFRGEGIVALVGVPLIWNEEVVGLLFVADRYQRNHTALNTSILSTLATHAAVAIKNAKAFEQAKAALEEADKARAQLERHILSVKSAVEAHEQMTSLLAKGASLSSLCQSVAQSLGGSVMVLDEAGCIISSGTALEYAGSEAESYKSQYSERSVEIVQALRQSRQLGRAVVAYQAHGEVCRIMAVFGGNDVLGSVMLFHTQDLDEISIRTFERSASIIGIVLLSAERTEAGKNRDVSILLRSLVSLRQEPLSILSDRAHRFGLDLSQPISLILIEVDEAKASYAAKRLRARPEMSSIVLDEIDGIIAILCGTTRAKDIVHTVTTLGKPEFGSTYRGVISKPLSSPTEIPALYATLRRALSVLARLGIQGHIIGQNEMALYSTLFETYDRASLDSFLETTIGSLLAHDLKRGSELTSTLLVYFDSNQNIKTTTGRLGIHVNTVRQRLSTIEGLLGHWGNATRALEIHMALRLWSLSTPDTH